MLTDNSPAPWAFSRAFAGWKYSLDEIREFLGHDGIPFAYATKKDEKDRMRFKRTLGAADNVNKRGWKLCHVEDVGLGTSAGIEELPIDHLIRHFCRLLMPSNHFLIPLEWAGLGELPQVIDEIRKHELASLESP